MEQSYFRNEILGLDKLTARLELIKKSIPSEFITGFYNNFFISALLLRELVKLRAVS